MANIMRAPSSLGRGGGGRGRDGGRGGGRGGRSFGRGFDDGPPAQVVELGIVMHECESEMICKVTEKESKLPYFNAGVYLETKKKIGKVDEVFGPIHNVMFTVKPDPGIVAKSFEKDDIVFIGSDKLLPLSRFTNPSKPGGRSSGRGRGGRGGRGGFSPGGGRGGRGGFSAGRGGRGGFSPRGGGGRFAGRGRQ